MKDKDFNNIIEFCYMGGGWMAVNEKAQQLEETCRKGDIISFNEVTARDLSFHKGYFSLLGYIWSYLPANFKKKIQKKDFYMFLKTLKGDYQVKYTFKDGRQYCEYKSISFGNMSDKRFKEYVREQLPFIYSNVIAEFYSGDIYDNVVENIELEFEKLINRI